MEAFRIGEFALKNGISVQLLKYYDQHGILPPAWKDETGRYYMDYQSIHLLEYRYLNGTGLSLQEAKRLREQGALADWLAQLSRAHSVVEKEIIERQGLLRFVDEMRDCLEQIRHRERWRIEPWEGGWFMPKEYALGHPWQQDGIAVPQIWQRVTAGAPPGANAPQSLWGTLLPKNVSQDLTGAEAVQAGPCFVYVHSLRNYNVSDLARVNDPTVDFAEPLRLMADNHLEPRGDLYQRRLCVTHEGPEAQMQVMVRIPLRLEGGGAG